MSDKIPEGMTSGDIPYCIWYPDIAAEETYRKLALMYPQMAYHVGRACAVAGYTQLYKELSILPEVHIAEEARECGNMAIFEEIMSHPIRYSVMNDYELRIEDPQGPAYLNGDTAVRWMLDIKQQLEDPSSPARAKDDVWDQIQLRPLLRDAVFNITEDLNINAADSDEAADKYDWEYREKHFVAVRNREVFQLLCQPLPADLPTVKKEILINMAAYHGNIDRYVRLRRPKLVPAEVECCMRGIYHHPTFARWWTTQPNPGRSIRTAINARFIMSDILSGAPFADTDIPYLIWWPQLATRNTYRHLAAVHKNMHVQIVHACIYANNNPDLFDELLPQITPTTALFAQAKRSCNPHYHDSLMARIAALGLECPVSVSQWKDELAGIPHFTPAVANVKRYMEHRDLTSPFDGPYDDVMCDASEVEMMACMPENWFIPAEDTEEIDRAIDYKSWPPIDGVDTSMMS